MYHCFREQLESSGSSQLTSGPQSRTPTLPGDVLGASAIVCAGLRALSAPTHQPVFSGELLVQAVTL